MNDKTNAKRKPTTNDERQKKLKKFCKNFENVTGERANVARMPLQLDDRALSDLRPLTSASATSAAVSDFCAQCLRFIEGGSSKFHLWEDQRA